MIKGVLVKNMIMPNSCYDCPFNMWDHDNGEVCAANHNTLLEESYTVVRPLWCPLKEVNKND